MAFSPCYLEFLRGCLFLECWRALDWIVGCLVAVISCSRVVVSAFIFMLLVSLVVVWPVPEMWAVGSSLFGLSG